MTIVDVYTKRWCACSSRAVSLLRSRGISYNEINITDDSERENEMKKRSGRLSAPQVFFGHVHIGGNDDLFVADQCGLLEKLLHKDAS